MKKLMLIIGLLLNTAMAETSQRYVCEATKFQEGTYVVTLTARQKAAMPMSKGTLTIDSINAKYDWNDDFYNFKYGMDDQSGFEIYANDEAGMLVSKDRKTMIIKSDNISIVYACKSKR